MGSPAGSSGTGTGSRANVYSPMGQPTADWNWWQVIQPLINASAGGGAGTPGGWAYPQAQSVYNQYLAPGQSLTDAISLAQQASDYWKQTGFPAATANAATLGGYGNQILGTAFDPRSQAFNRGQQQLVDQSNAINAMSGLGGTPYGASVTSNALGNYDINWQNQQLARQQAGLGAAGQAFSGANQLGLSGAQALGTLGAAPYNFGAMGGQNALSGLGSTVNIGNQQYLLPQQVLNDLQAYMGLGQSASGISGQLGQMGFNQLATGIGGLGSLAGGTANLLGGGSSLLGTGGSLFGGSAPAALSSADLGTLAAGGEVFGGGGDATAGLLSLAPLGS